MHRRIMRSLGVAQGIRKAHITYRAGAPLLSPELYIRTIGGVLFA